MNLNRKHLCGLSALLASLYAVPAMAGFEIIDEQPAAVISSGETTLFGAPESAAIVHVVQVGRPDPSLVELRSGGKADAANALKLIAPKDWRGYQRGKPDLSQVVTWSGGQDWVAAMNEALKGTNLMVELDWAQKKVSVFDLPAQVKVAGASRPAMSRKMTWEVRSGESLREALARWMLVANLQLAWEIPNDFELKAGATFNGSVEDALRQLAESVGINIVLYKGNQVCVVSEGTI